jgi:hypothetical protein
MCGTAAPVSAIYGTTVPISNETIIDINCSQEEIRWKE